MRSLIATTAIAIAATAHAYDAERAANNLAHEAAECGAYFMLMSTAPGLDESTTRNLKGHFETLIALSAGLTSEKLVKARFELAIQSMKREIAGSWSNASILNNKYGHKCIDLVRGPDARMRFWLNKRD